MVEFDDNLTYNIYICGVGGQGIIKTSMVIGEACIFDDIKVSMSEIHGMSQRGGVVSTELKIGDAHSSIIPEGNADILLAFEPVEAVRALNKVNKNTHIIFNTSPIIPSTIYVNNQEYPSLDEIIAELEKASDFVFSVDAEKIALDAGHILSLNMVMLGAACAVNDFPISKESIVESMKNNLPEKSIDTNLKAFNQGFESINTKL